MKLHKLAAFALAVGSLSACGLNVPDLNNPGLDELESHPTAVSIGAAATGLLIGNRLGHSSENGYVSQLGIIGREAYCFDSADPRFISELIQGTLNAGSPFGGNFWPLQYANIRLANIVLRAVDNVGELDDAAKSSIRGFTKTIEALDLLYVITTHDTNGAVVDTDKKIDEPLGAIVGKAAVMTAIVGLLEDGATDLGKAGDAFPFKLDEGYLGFDTPATFLTFNRALRARVAVYQAADSTTPAVEYGIALTALAASFLDDTTAPLDFSAGVYYTYTTKSGDTTNGLINPNIYAHPTIETDAKKTTGNVVDARLTAKIETKKSGSAKGLSSTVGFTMYNSPSSPVSVIRNEELILLKAEALFFTGMVPAAIAELNLVRVGSGKLQPLAGVLSAAAFTDELLYDRRYSLLFEGHRWIDVRRFNRMNSLPLDMPTNVINVRYPIPLPECNARPGEPRCALGSL